MYGYRSANNNTQNGPKRSIFLNFLHTSAFDVTTVEKFCNRLHHRCGGLTGFQEGTDEFDNSSHDLPPAGRVLTVRRAAVARASA
jgi:hypothetical protein